MKEREIEKLLDAADQIGKAEPDGKAGAGASADAEASGGASAEADLRAAAEKEKRQRRNRRAKLALCAAAAAAAGIFLLVRFVLPNMRHISEKEYFGIEDEAADVGIATEDGPFETAGKLIDGKVYLPCGLVTEMIDEGIYHDEEARLLIATRPTEVVTVLADGTDDAFAMSGETAYVSADFVEENGSGECVYLEEKQRLIVRTSQTYVKAAFSKNESVRSGDSAREPIVAEAKAGDACVLTEGAAGEDGAAEIAEEDGWVKVMTEDGFVGYVPASSVEGAEAVTEEIENREEFTHLLSEDKVTMAFHQVTSQSSNNAFSKRIKGASGLTHVAPTWFFLESETGEMSSLASSKYVKRAHKKDLKVVAVMNDFDGAVSGRDATAAALSTYENRQRMITAALSGVEASGADGICVDFENVGPDSAGDYIEFLRELSAECRTRGLVLCVCDYVPTFTSYYNRKSQAAVVDYIVCMCYDEHNASSAEAGSVASLGFVSDAINATLAEVPAEQLIAALPFYTRLWTTYDGTVECESLGMAEAKERVATMAMETEWDEEKAQVYAKTEIEGKTYEIWLETAESLEAKLEAVEGYSCAGAAFWKLGMQDETAWPVVEEYAGAAESEEG